MGIKDKDGNVYKLRGPNPIMAKQDQWDKSKIKLINAQWEDIIFEDEDNAIDKFKSDYNVRDIGEVLDLSSITEEQTEVVDKPIEQPKVKKEPELPKEEIPETVDQKTAAFFRKNKTICYCAPAVEEIHEDDLYGESYKRIIYEKKFTFEAIVVSMSDFELKLWTIKEIPSNSIVYPKDRSKRWWKVEKCESKTGGFLIQGFISDVNPDFG